VCRCGHNCMAIQLEALEKFQPVRCLHLEIALRATNISDAPQNEANRADPQNDGADPRGPQIRPEQIQMLTPQDIEQQLDVYGAAGFIKRYRPGV
jgi:hypothetical protein